MVEQIYATIVDFSLTDHLHSGGNGNGNNGINGNGGGSGSGGDGIGTSFDEIAGAIDAKQVLQEAVQLPLALPELFQGLTSPWRGVLLYGPPGTGKTLLARAAASVQGATFLNVAVSALGSKWRGESEKLVKVLFGVSERGSRREASWQARRQTGRQAGRQAGRQG